LGLGLEGVANGATDLVAKPVAPNPTPAAAVTVSTAQASPTSNRVFRALMLPHFGGLRFSTIGGSPGAAS